MAVDVWRDELILCLSFVSNVGFEICASLVVEDLEVHCEAAFGEALHDGVVGGKGMCISLVGIWRIKDDVGEFVVGDCDVLVASPCADGKSACVVGVELGERHFCDVELVGEG